MYKIDDGIEMPKTTGRKKYGFSDLQIGQSFFVPDTDQKKATRILAAPVSIANSRLAPKRFLVASVVEAGVLGARVWRTK